MIIDEGKKTKMFPAICTQCGGQVEVDAQWENAICPHCGTQFLIEKAINTNNIQQATVEHVDSIIINKTSSLESVLSFVKDQQKRKDEEKKEKKEEERKAREESDKFFKKYGWILLLMIVISFAWLNFKSLEEKKNEISINNSSGQLEGMNYQDVVLLLQENGFTNIKTEVKKDLVFGWLANDGEVDRVEINGDHDFSSGSKFQKDAEIIVTYHTFR